MTRCPTCWTQVQIVPAASDAPGGSTPIFPPVCSRTSANQNVASLFPMSLKPARAFPSVREAWNVVLNCCQFVVSACPWPYPNPCHGSCAIITDELAFVAGLAFAQNEIVYG